MRVLGPFEAGRGVACGESGRSEGAVRGDWGARGLGERGVDERGGVAGVEWSDCLKRGEDGDGWMDGFIRK